MLDNTWKFDNPGWVACCCGCLPPYALLAGLLLCVPYSVLGFVSVAVVHFWTLPVNVFQSYHVLVTTPYWGPNIKVITFLLLPVLIVLLTITILLVAMAVPLVAGFVFPMGIILGNDGAPYGPVHILSKLWSEYWEHITTFHKYSSIELRSLLDGCRHPDDARVAQYVLVHGGPTPDPNMIEPWDIQLHLLPVCLAVGALATIWDVLLLWPILLLWFLPVVLRCYKTMWQAYFESDTPTMIMCAVVFIMVQLLFPPVAVLLLLIFMTGVVLFGVSATVEYYKEGWDAVRSKHVEAVGKLWDVLKDFVLA